MQSQLPPQAAVGAGSEGELLPSSGNWPDSNGELVATATDNIPPLPGFEQRQEPIVRYTIEELLLLRDTCSSQIPIDLSPFTPLRLGSQVKSSEPSQGLRSGKKVIATNPFMGLEHIPRSHKAVDAYQLSQKAGGSSHQSRGQQTNMNRVAGVSRGAGRSQSLASADGTFDEHHRNGGASTRGAGAYSNTMPPRDGHGKAGGASHTAPRHHSSSHDGNRAGGALSWRSSTPNRASSSNMHSVADTRGNSTAIDAAGQPEWMDSDMIYDESLSAQRMQDMEDWKRRMKETTGAHHGQSVQSNELLSQSPQHILSDDANNGPARGSRFLRLFSENPSQQDVIGIQPDGGNMQAQNNAYYNGAAGAGAASVYANGMAMGSIEAQTQYGQGVNGSGDQISKLFKVLGDRISVNGTQSAEWNAAQNPANMLGDRQPMTAADVIAAQNQNLAPPMVTMHPGDLSAMSHPQRTTSSGIRAEPKKPLSPASSISQQTESVVSGAHRLKTASPAPINEALRGIVPTSVFRKSVQNSSGYASSANGSGSSSGRYNQQQQHQQQQQQHQQQQRSDSITSSRSGTPAKSLPQWLVELSRGRSASPTNNQMPTDQAAPATSQPPVHTESRGPQDMVDALEREFPSLGIRPQNTDNQSISSLSVQASVGAPSEGTGGDSSMRHSTIETREQESPPQASNAANHATQLGDGGISYQMPLPDVVTSGPGTTRDIAATAAPRISQVAEAAAIRNSGSMTSPDPMHMHVLPPQAMMDMPPPPPPHMMMPDGTVVPGMVPHPSLMGAGQMPPMGMMPPHHAMGFHPNMMFGMMPPPMHPGMFGSMPPANMPMSVGQMSGIPGPTTEHQQQMIKMMMMSDMPPGMIYGPMGSGAPQPQPQPQPQQQQQQQQQMPPLQQHMPAHPATNGHMYSAAMVQQAPPAFHHHQQQQQQHQSYEP